MDNKVLFVHDGPILSNQDLTVFYGVHYNDELINRYLFFGNKVSFLMRHQVIKDNDTSRYSKITNKAFNFIDLPNFKSIKTYNKKSQSIKIIKKAVDAHDVIILRLPSAAGTIAFKYAKTKNKPILIEMVACVYDALWNYDWRGKLIAKYKMKKYQSILKSATHVIYVTDIFLQSRYPTNGKSIGCSDVILKNPDETILEKRLDKINNLSNEIILGTISAVDVIYKGQAEVIGAIAVKNNKQNAFKYKIVGQGNPTRLTNLINKLQVNDDVDILGSLSHDKVFNFIDEIDLYIQPSKTEGMPRAVIEAMSRACPVVGSNVGGIPELINKESLFEVGSIDGICAILEKIDKETLKKWAIENFENVKKFRKETLDQYRLTFYNQFKKDYNLDKVNEK